MVISHSRDLQCFLQSPVLQSSVHGFLELQSSYSVPVRLPKLVRLPEPVRLYNRTLGEQRVIQNAKVYHMYC